MLAYGGGYSQAALTSVAMRSIVLNNGGFPGKPPRLKIEGYSCKSRTYVKTPELR